MIREPFQCANSLLYLLDEPVVYVVFPVECVVDDDSKYAVTTLLLDYCVPHYYFPQLGAALRSDKEESGFCCISYTVGLS